MIALSCSLRFCSSFRRNVNFPSLRFSTKKAEKPSLPSRNDSGEKMKVLNVAEKNDAAKNIAALLSRGNSNRREGLSMYNKIYEFDMRLFNQDCRMVMTSVSGHLLTYEFCGNHRKWHGCHPLALFDAPVVKQCAEDNYLKIKKTLEREAKSCSALVIWTDCDREGENIGFEIITVCQAVKPNLRVYRAKFSEITQASIQRAIQTLGEPNKAISDAVDVRSELDLRIGAAFTRFQTLRLTKVFPRTLTDLLISYGSCQFPTLGFVVERFLAIERFQSEPYWKIKVTDNRDGLSVEFRWGRQRLFEEMPCQIYLDMCLEQPHATVEKVVGKPKSKWRPLPLDTIELEKQGSRKLRMNAKETMKVAEKLYTRGLISYPRTETNIFPKELNLRPLVEQQLNNEAWGGFAQRVLDDGISPRQGKKSDQAHPPIHPTKFAAGLEGNEAKVYEFVVRHFLACVSKNAEGHETTVEIDIAGEKFVASGLQILAKNYLDVYIYEKWNAKEIHAYEQSQVFTPTSIEMVRENTSPPNLLTEADLIALMDKHGIGTDATHADHIDTIKARHYVGLRDGTYFIPGKLGIGLVMGYDNMGFQMSKPNLRAELESDLKEICEGRKDPKDVLQVQINKYRDVFKIAVERANLIDTALAGYLDEAPTQAPGLENIMPLEDPTVLKCPRCGLNMTLKSRRQGGGKYIGCVGYPACTNAIWLPSDVTELEVLDEICPQCPGDVHKINVKTKPGAYPFLGTSYTACIGGCDQMFNEMMNIRNENIRPVNRPNDSGYASGSTSTQNAASGSAPRSTQSANSRSAPTGSRGGSSAGSRGGSSAGSRGGSSTGSRGGSSAGSRGGSSTGSRPTGGQIGNVALSATANRRPASSSAPAKRPAVATNVTVPIANRENAFPAWGELNEDVVVLCDCHENAVRRTVAKDGPTKGRLFYACAKPRDTQCRFFLWADSTDEDAQSNNAQQTRTNNSTQQGWSNNNPQNAWPSNNAQPARPRSSSNSRNPPPSGGSAPMCACGQPAVGRTVRKEGPNTGRKFWGCPQGAGSSCNFFAWADETNAGDSAGGGWGGGNDENNWDVAPAGRGRGRAAPRGRGRAAPRAPGAKRKCGLCQQEGHTRRTCPQNSMD